MTTGPPPACPTPDSVNGSSGRTGRTSPPRPPSARASSRASVRAAAGDRSPVAVAVAVGRGTARRRLGRLSAPIRTRLPAGGSGGAVPSRDGPAPARSGPGAPAVPVAPAGSAGRPPPGPRPRSGLGLGLGLGRPERIGRDTAGGGVPPSGCGASGCGAGSTSRAGTAVSWGGLRRSTPRPSEPDHRNRSHPPQEFASSSLTWWQRGHSFIAHFPFSPVRSFYQHNPAVGYPGQSRVAAGGVPGRPMPSRASVLRRMARRA